MYTYEERKEFELKRRTTVEAQAAFFRGAMIRMAIDDNIKTLERDHEFACDVLSTCGFCASNLMRCDRCPLESKYDRAIMEIRFGLRGPNLKEEFERKVKNA